VTLTAETISDPALSLTGCQWVMRESDERQIAALVQRHGLPEVLARVLAARGVALDEVDGFLNPSLKASIPDPSHLIDMDVAAGRVATAIMGGERLAIFGDYDVDGATSSALLARYFRALGGDPLIHIPDRVKEGYGPNAPALLNLKAQGASVVITVDCGTLAFEPLEAAHQAGLDVIVIDHHTGEARKPRALALVNPNRLDESSPHRQLAAVGVAFLLAVAVNRKLRESNWFATRREPDLKQWLDLVALGTICDVVPLTGINRALVAQGLKIMAGRGNTGIRTVLDLAGIQEKPGVYHAGFVVGPRINAGGRVGKSDLGVRLLTTEDEAEALSLAKELEVHNAERKAIEAMVIEEAFAMAEAQAARAPQPLLMLSGRGWHQGVIGIVAGRIKERFHLPAVVVALENGIGKASARSVTGIDMGAAVIAARDAGLLLAGGGHAMAAGFTVEEDKLAALTEFLIKRIGDQAVGLLRQKQIMLDGTLGLSGATLELVETMERLGPFGQGNPSVRVVLSNVVNLKPEIVGEQHVKTLLIDRLSNARISAIAFRARDTRLGEALLATRGKEIRLAGQLRINEWNGRRSVNFTIEDIA
jgi:single-stranded-DNA-specific exonuclease